MGLDQYLYAEFPVPVDTELFAVVDKAASEYEYWVDGEMYVGGWDWYKDGAEKTLYNTLTELVGFTPNPESPHFDVFKGEDGEFKLRGGLYYWRKTNAVHNFFVQEAQGGVDECQYAPLEEGVLDELLTRIALVQADPDKAPQLLPPVAGFFFGSTDFDEWYFEDLKNTAEKLPEWILKAEVAGATGYAYRSSW